MLAKMVGMFELQYSLNISAFHFSLYHQQEFLYFNKNAQKNYANLLLKMAKNELAKLSIVHYLTTDDKILQNKDDNERLKSTAI